MFRVTGGRSVSDHVSAIETWSAVDGKRIMYLHWDILG
jgi:hypothetical protein